MKRMHMHVKVENLGQSIAFYSALFAMRPSVEKPDYAKWMVEDPRVNFAISTGGTKGVNHVGIQAETPEELDSMYQQLAAAQVTTLDETGANCCYAKSDKHWAMDPTGIVWEMYRTMDAIEVYGTDRGNRTEMAQPTPMLAHDTGDACGASCGITTKARIAAKVCCG
jgi:hypothetical protein